MSRAAVPRPAERREEDRSHVLAGACRRLVALPADPVLDPGRADARTLLRRMATEHIPGNADFPTTWQGGHALIVEYGDCELYGICQCGTPLGMITPDQSLDVFATAWERHVMRGDPA